MVGRRFDPFVGALIALVGAGASVALALTGGELVTAVESNPAEAALYLALVLALQCLSVPVYGQGAVSVTPVGVLAAGFALGVGPAMAIAIAAALFQWLRTRGLFHRAVFDAATFALSAGAGVGAYELVRAVSGSAPSAVAAALVAGVTYAGVNVVLLCAAIGLSEKRAFAGVWRERFRWMSAYDLAFGPLALALATAEAEIGAVGVLAFVVPPALMALSARQYVERTRSAVDEVRTANDELRRANEQLATANSDLYELFRFSGGLAARTHDRGELLAYVEKTLATVAGMPVRIVPGDGAAGVRLVAGGRQVGALAFAGAHEGDATRWPRLRAALLPQLATAVETAELVERVKKTHLATIAALSRSMEAKDLYTGGHTERVAKIAVALAERLGYEGAELEAIQVGALLHDVGKIGVPESILQKPGPLTEGEWRRMREHPLISEYILSEVDLHPIVHQIARSSHERIDGAGYPDGLRSDEIPLPARIVLVADAFDALTSDRPYRVARSTHEALREIRANAGTQFCPRVAEALERLAREDAVLLRADARVADVA